MLRVAAPLIALAAALAVGACPSRREEAPPVPPTEAGGAVAVAEAPAPAPAAPVTEPADAPEPTPTPAPRPTWRPNPAKVVSAEEAAAATACTAVAHIGDSTSTGMMSEKYVRDPERRLDRRYAAVGVEELRLELFGGRSLIEHRAGNENGLMVAERLRAAGFNGCWVIGLGTNDAANVAKDQTIAPAERIARMMRIIGDAPVLWIDAVTRRSDGYWAQENMAAWNAELAAALAGHPNARIYRWSAEIRDEWFVGDGIHYSSAGYAARAERVARALASAFPAGE